MSTHQSCASPSVLPDAARSQQNQSAGSQSSVVHLKTPAVPHAATAVHFPPHPFNPAAGLADSLGRVARDLRISVTDRCNLRCTYCMPAQGLEWLPRPALLTDEEIVRLLSLAVETLGITSIRFTGGEPLLRGSLEELIAAAAQLRTKQGRAPSLALTTNGLGLDKRAAGLYAAGLERINVSLDAATPEAFARITRRDRFADVIRGIRAAQEVGLSPIKINAVILPGVNEDQVVPLLGLCVDNGWQLRFIEQMPLGPREQWTRDSMVTAQDIHAVLSSVATLTPTGNRGSAPAELFDVSLHSSTTLSAPKTGQVGIIASVTQPFCAGCDRTRLTADGAIRNCLFGNDELSLRDLMRQGATDKELADAWSAITFAKKAGHGTDDVQGMPLLAGLQPERPMSALGG